MALIVWSSAFASNGRIPARYTCDGQERSPALGWSGAPAQTKSFAVVCADPDAPGGTFYHWALFDIAPGTAALPEGYGARADVKQGVNDFGNARYNGPCPPAGKPHRYVFTVYALGMSTLAVKAGAGCREVEHAAMTSALDRGTLIGRYGR